MAKATSHHSADFEDADRSSLGDVLEELRDMVREAESLLRDTDGPIGERVSEVRSRIEETMEDARAKLRDAGEKGGRVKNAAHKTESYVRENPWTAVLIAAGLGYMIANMGRRR
jgi:ElaB/YqjD/DUF883 family membrane-anchored ribosome-binding protein